MSMALPTRHPIDTRDNANGFAAALAAGFKRYDQWRSARRAMRQLSSLSDAMLHDMGITRDEIPGAVLHGRERPALRPE